MLQTYISRKNSQRLQRAIPIIFYTLLTTFLVFYIQTIDIDQLKSIKISWVYIGVASIFGLAFRFWGTLIWFVLLRGLGAKIDTSKTELSYVYAKSWLGRYIPGTAPWILGKIYFASKHGISKNKLAVSSLLEGSLQVVVVMVLAFLMLSFDRRLDVVDVRAKILMFVFICTGVVALIPFVFNKIIASFYKILKKKSFPKEHVANSKIIVKGAFLYTIGAIISGLSLFFIAKAVYPELSYSNILFVMGVGNLAGAVSMLAFFAPSGLGVREGIQLALLSLIMPSEYALVITVVTRVWGVAIDFLFFGINRLLLYAKSSP